MDKVSIEEMIEGLYWKFDAAKNGYGEFKNRPISERDAFKAVMRKAISSVDSSEPSQG